MRLRRNDVFTTVVEGQTVVLDAAASSYLQTNAAGTTLLDVLADGEDHEMPELTGALVHRFELDAETAQRDATAFVMSLREHGLLAD